MTSRPDTATLMPIGDASIAFDGYKVRTAGMIAEYDQHSAIVTLRSGKDTINVDVSLVLDHIASANLLRTGQDVFVIGMIESISDQKVKINCLQIFDCTGLNLLQWEQAARKMSQLIHRREEGKNV